MKLRDDEKLLILRQLKQKAYELDYQIKTIEGSIYSENSIELDTPESTSASFKPVCDCCGTIIEELQICEGFIATADGYKIKSSSVQGQCPNCHKIIVRASFNKGKYFISTII